MDKKKITAISDRRRRPAFHHRCGSFSDNVQKQDPVESLQKSIGYADGKLQFTIPETYNDSWYIQISGRTQMEEGGVSVHYLEENSTGKSWEKNRELKNSSEESCAEMQQK